MENTAHKLSPVLFNSVLSNSVLANSVLSNSVRSNEVQLKKVQPDKLQNAHKVQNSHKARNAVTLLRTDDEEVSELFVAYEKSKSVKEKIKIADEICTALTIHGHIEEQIFYPPVKSLKESESIPEALYFQKQNVLHNWIYLNWVNSYFNTKKNY